MLRCASLSWAYVDDLKARLFEELRCLVSKPSFSDSFGGPCRLVDVDTIERPHWASVTFSVFWTGSDDVGQYVYARGLWAVLVSVSFLSMWSQKLRTYYFLLLSSVFANTSFISA